MNQDIEATRALTENLYYIVGFVVVSGFGALVTGIKFAIDKIVWIAKMEAKVDQLEKDVNSAFKMLRDRDPAEIQDLRDELIILSRDVRKAVSGEAGDDN